MQKSIHDSTIDLIKNELKGLQINFPFLPENYTSPLALDIETSPKPEFVNLDKAALNYFTGQIDIVGFVGYHNQNLIVAQFDIKSGKHSLSDVRAFLVYLLSIRVTLTGHNTKFDLKYLIHNEVITFEEACLLWKHDSSIAAAVSVKKIPDKWLEKYEAIRMEINKNKEHGTHRKAGGGSLKTLAPFHLGIEAFWETADHSNAKYNLLDCLYTYYLTFVLYKQVQDVGAVKCYEDLIERSKLLMRAELDGIALDINETKSRMAETAEKIKVLEAKINEQWAAHFDIWRGLQQSELKNHYIEMTQRAVLKDKKKRDEAYFWETKYNSLYDKAVSKADFSFNLDSPVQLKWLLKEQLGLDITDLKDDEEESTGKAVLEHLSSLHPEVGVLLQYRKLNKLQTSFYPRLLEYSAYDARVHMNFNIAGARTGRLSSSSPNIQQIPKDLKSLFMADPGNVLVDLDMSMLEPILIAYYTGDEVLTDLILNGHSFHSYNAKVMFNLDCDISEVADKFKTERKAAKLAGLSILYGSGAKQLMFSLTGLGYKFSIEECKKIVYRIRDAYPKVWEFKKELDKMAERGDIFYNYLGRPIKFDNPDDIYLKAFNTLIQGSGSDIVVQSATDFCKKYTYAKPRTLVHDSICVEVPGARAEETKLLLNNEMTKWDLGKLKFSTEGGYGAKWF